jgi:hypothetical protein
MKIKALSLSGITRTGSKGIISARYDKAPQFKGYGWKKSSALYTTGVFPAAKLVQKVLKTKYEILLRPSRKNGCK